MVRSLWTGATGMIAQQLNVDNISNNLANVNTTGYKSEAMEFKSLLYPLTEEEDEAVVKQINDTKPDFIWIGLGAPKQEKWMAAHAGMLHGVMQGGRVLKISPETVSISRHPSE